MNGDATLGNSQFGDVYFEKPVRGTGVFSLPWVFDQKECNEHDRKDEFAAIVLCSRFFMNERG